MFTLDRCSVASLTHVWLLLAETWPYGFGASVMSVLRLPGPGGCQAQALGKANLTFRRW